ncbi:2-amino-4-hydroxy-6-hydroxymethyldihydropteridine diphosphokinase [Paracoccus sp. Z118]|uniref:2-amino-4-hydroxy-6- hydroxymethyldihydropteridine diphosphokinase n=1 Tax=Paracoccus sp. Z118 TaxID=2851017 RepID=UPI003530203C
MIALGANLTSSTGFPDATLRAALRRIAASGARIVAVSRFRRTPAFPPGSGPDFVNACAALRTGLAAPDLLAMLHRIEAELGRTRHGGRWSARAIDLDLLAVGDEIWPDAATQGHWRALPPHRQGVEAPGALILPHPRLQDRGFVLVPLADIAPLWRHPLTGQTVAQMLAALPPDELAEIRPFP